MMKRSLNDSCRGYAFGALLQMLLLGLLLGMAVFLAVRHGTRFDLTEDRLFTLTESTQKVLDGFEDRMIVEAYFSADDELPVAQRDGRRILREVLDEYVQNSGGRMQIRYFDPQSDNELRKQAERLGMRPERIQDVNGTTLSNKEIWQGLRFRYGGKKQKVVPIIGFTDITAQYEKYLTPILKALTVSVRPKIGVAAWPSLPPMGRGVSSGNEPPQGYRQILEAEVIADRYELVPVDLAQGQHVSDDIDTLILIRPKNLTDRNKYVLDQFLMRGGRMTIFADSGDVSIGRSRLFQSRPISYDQIGSDHDFLAQLRYYGAEVRNKVVADMAPSPETFNVPQINQMGQRVFATLQYPYWMQPTVGDWAEIAEQLATSDGSVDEALRRRYQQILAPGVDPEIRDALVAPVFYWPCPVELADPLPAQVEGKVLMRTSPKSIEEVLPQDVNPIGGGQNMDVALARFSARMRTLFDSSQPTQRGLMVELRGGFRSFFEGKRVPPAPGEEAETAPERDPLAEPVGADPTDPDAVGPQPDDGSGDQPGKPSEAALLRAEPGARLIVVGDADFIRDDIVMGEHAQAGGPYSSGLGFQFFMGLLDWLAEDRDLMELNRKGVTDRRMHLIAGADLERFGPAQREQALKAKAAKLRWLNILAPPALLLLAGLVIVLRRVARKRAFLAGVS